eukprot:COSAG02_NODE_2233_length_9425_cov_2.280399_1_plen_116_part_00
MQARIDWNGIEDFLQTLDTLPGHKVLRLAEVVRRSLQRIERHRAVVRRPLVPRAIGIEGQVLYVYIRVDESIDELKLRPILNILAIIRIRFVCVNVVAGPINIDLYKVSLSSDSK